MLLLFKDASFFAEGGSCFNEVTGITQQSCSASQRARVLEGFIAAVRQGAGCFEVCPRLAAALQQACRLTGGDQQLCAAQSCLGLF